MKELSVGDEHFLICDDKGDVYSCGNNTCGQLGRDGNNPVKCSRFLPIIFPRNLRAISVSAKKDYSFAVCEDGGLFFWGEDLFGLLKKELCYKAPQAVTYFIKKNIKLKKVSAGDKFAVFLSENGEVYYIIDNKIIKSPSHPDGKKFTKISAGKDCFLVQDENHRIFSLEPRDYRPSLREILPKFLLGENVQAMSTGFNHFLFLTKQGNVFVAGDNDHNQLGINTSLSISFRIKPANLTGLPKICAVSAGFNYSVLLTAEGDLLVFGQNHYGQLGTGDYKARKKPFKVQGLPKIVAMAAGCYFSLLADVDGNLFLCGNKDICRLFSPPDSYNRYKMKLTKDSFQLNMFNNKNCDCKIKTLI